MIHLFKISLLFCLVVNAKTFSTQNAPSTIIPHSIQIKHLGISLTEKIEQTLFEVKNEKGQSEAFYMDVETVVCGDAQCKIDIIRVFWDELGFYSHLVLPAKVELEKADGKHFDQKDYDKLDEILANKKGSLKDVYKEEVVGSESSDGVDGISGATIILNTNDYVAGAVWTCYTLWHWTNGDIYSIIRNITSDNLSRDDLMVLFKNDSTKEKVFALEQMSRRELHQPEVVELVVENAPSNNYELTKLTIDYIENTSDTIFAEAIQTLLQQSTSKQRTPYLNALSTTKHPLPTSFWESISAFLTNWNDYPSINQLLNLLAQNKVVSASILNEMIGLLKQEDFILARRAYWFLEEQTLNQQQQQIRHSFFLKNQDRL